MKDVLFGKTLLFQGDSITYAWRSVDNDDCLGLGYVASVANAYKAFFPESGAKFMNRGVSGDRITNLLSRYKEDFVKPKPDWISIMIGINDVWRAFDDNDPTEASVFEQNYEKLLTQIKRDLPAAKIVIIEPFILHSLLDRESWHSDFDPKLQAVRKMAAKYADYFLPMDGLFASYVTSGISPAELAADGVHPTAKGHGIIAYEWLRQIGSI